MIKGIFVRWIVTSFAIIFASQIIKGIEIASIKAAFISATVLGILNALVKPVLILISFPLTILTFGLFLFVINGLLLYLVSFMVKGFVIERFISAIFGALIVSIAVSIVDLFID